MNTLFETIKKTRAGSPEALQGWCELAKANTLAGIVLALRPDISVEIGVFGGSSFIPIALAHKAVGRGIAIGIDAWSKSVAIREQTTPEHRKWWAELDIDKIHDGFQVAVEKYQLRPFTDIIRSESKNFQPPHNIGLLHIDGAHSGEAVNDVYRFAPKVHAGGFVVMDDIDGAHGQGPIDAANRLVSMGFKRLFTVGTWAVFQRA